MLFLPFIRMSQLTEGVCICRYEDTYPVNNLAVFAKKTSASSVKDFGSPSEFLDKHKFLFGENVSFIPAWPLAVQA